MKRRALLFSGALLGIGLLSGRIIAQSSDIKVIPRVDRPVSAATQAESPVKDPAHWEGLDTQIRPTDRSSSVAHYNRPQIAPKTWQLDEVSGDVRKPMSLTLDQLEALPRHR
jgi:DMSO/TMAO reductase YedYZ molybdopterin-dependent catalytic subunit